MKKSVFAALAVLSLFALPAAHADERGIEPKSVASSVPAGEASSTESVSGVLGKLLGTIVAAPKNLVNTVAPSAIGGVKTMASNFGTGFKRAFSPDEGNAQSAAASNHGSTEAQGHSRSHAAGASISDDASSSTSEKSSLTAHALPESVGKAIAMLRKPPVNLEAPTESN